MRLLLSKQAFGHLLFGAVGAAVFLAPSDLPFKAKMAFGVFWCAIWAWTMTRTDATLVAVLAAMCMWGLGLNGDEKVLSALGDPFVAFVIAGFMLGGAYKAAGLSERIAGWFARYSTNIGQLFYLLTAALVLLSFVVPSTAARAALLMPVYLAVAGHCPSPSVRKGLAVLFPSVIVLSCVTSYLGAGANLMTADLAARFSGERITYLQWLALGAPLGITSCFLSTWIIMRLFLTAQDRAMPFRFEAVGEQALAPAAQRRVLGVTALLVLLWVTEPWHGIDAGMVTLAGALALCLPEFGVFTFKQALKEVEWSLVVFMAATIEISKGLVNSGVAAYAMRHFSGAVEGWSAYGILLVLISVSLLSHLFIHSRTARAAVMLPVLIPIGISAGHGGVMIAFFANAAMGYCLTLPVCAKPVAMFSTAGGEGYTTRDLLRLSTWLLPLHLVLFMGGYALYSCILGQ
jgi:solute carrier family 13 (sodium-dependent dicarboxylate transporter), member 2/3/5